MSTETPPSPEQELLALTSSLRERVRSEGESGEKGFVVDPSRATATIQQEMRFQPQAPETRPAAPQAPVQESPPAQTLLSTPAPPTQTLPPTPAPPAQTPPVAAPVTPPSRPQARVARIEDVPKGADGLAKVSEILGACTRCRLHTGRTNLVFGEGNADADLMFIGEGPGAQEDQQGRPFVGPAGQLLDRMIVAMGLGREQVYIANVVKCRPPRNRDPEIDERHACRAFLLGQIEAIQPKVIVTLGRVATQAVLETEERISRMRGRWYTHPHCSVDVMPTYHPAALLRNQQLRRPVWEDLQQAMGKLGLQGNQ